VTEVYTPGSFTKNFSWKRSYRKLYDAVRNGYSRTLEPVSRDTWRCASGVSDINRQLIPMNFFLYSVPGPTDDYLLVDQFVEVALDSAYGPEFSQLSLFVFHQANSGRWKNSPWPDGRVAGWANDYIREISSSKGAWPNRAFDEGAIADFLDSRIDAEPVTKRKMLTNYRYMLHSAGVLVNDELQSENLRQRWHVDAVQVFWDRLVFDSAVPANAKGSMLEEVLIDNEVFKLLRCDKDQCRAFARAAYAEFSDGQGAARVSQIDQLRIRGMVA
jgi:hypothetical protein